MAIIPSIIYYILVDLSLSYFILLSWRSALMSNFALNAPAARIQKKHSFDKHPLHQNYLPYFIPYLFTAKWK